MMRKGTIPVLVAVILALSLVAVAGIISDTAISIKNKGHVTVKGFAKQEIKSDLGILGANITVEGPDLKTCYEVLSANKNRTMDFLKNKHSVADDEVALMPAYIQERYKINERGHDTEELIKYVLNQRLKIVSADVGKIQDISTGLADILGEGIKISVESPEYVYTKLDDLKVEMIGKATNNARERGLRIAREGRFKLGAVSSVRVGIFQITPLFSTEVSDYGMNDTSTIHKEIKSVVEIRYFVK